MPLLPLQPLLADFAAARRIIRTARHALHAGLHQREETPQRFAREVLGHALDYLNQAREGFTLSVRTDDVTGADEIRFLLRDALLDWHALEAWGFSLTPDPTIYQPGPQMMTFTMTAIALGFLPRLPPDEITFPLPPATYRDIAAPRTPGEMMTRLEELEQVIRQASALPLAGVDTGALRRTYGFFEASLWLIEREWARFQSPPE